MKLTIKLGVGKENKLHISTLDNSVINFMY